MREIKKSTVHVHGIQEDQKKMIEDTNRSYFRSMMVHASRGFRVAWIHLVRVAKATVYGGICVGNQAHKILKVLLMNACTKYMQGIKSRKSHLSMHAL